MTWPAVVPGAAMRAMRVAARSRALHWAWRVVLLAGTVFVLGVLCGERARAAEPAPMPQDSLAAGVVSDAGSVLTGSSGTGGARTDSGDESPGPVRAVVERTVRAVEEPVEEPVRDAVGDVARSAAGDEVRTAVGGTAGQAADHRVGKPIGDIAGKTVGDAVGKTARDVVGKTARDVVGKTVGGLMGKSVGEPAGVGRNVPALPELPRVQLPGLPRLPELPGVQLPDVQPLPELPKLPDLPSLPVLPGLTDPEPLPEVPGDLEAPQRTLPAPLAPETGQKPAPESGRSPEPGSSPALPPAGDASTSGDRTEKRVAVAPAAVHGPKPALTDITAGLDISPGSAPARADGSAAGLADGAGGAVPAPFPGVPGDRPDGSQGGRSAADHGQSRSGDLQAVAAHPCRPQLVLAPGARAYAGASETRDRYEDVPVPPA
ncbi:hypothetical protein [Streptomyces thermocarboxydovorans]|uniref:hypothetical protein n=1 Tax=Streptomyces thermocarboxydovorans TaxID=59298 RepID=UPI0031D39204